MESNLILVIIFSLIGGVFSLIGGVLLLAKKSWSKPLAKYATPFAAGALLATVFIELLPEAAHEGDVENALFATLIGILVFFLLERTIHWFHHRADHDEDKKDARAPLIIAGDTLHNAIDGVAIAAGFLIDPAVGIVTTLAAAAHEIPHEIGDFGLLLGKGLSRGKVLLINVLSALTTTIAAVVLFVVGQETTVPLDIALGLTAGFFIYIAVSDIIPAIHAHEKKRFVGLQSILMLVGVLVVTILTEILHGFMEV